MAKDSSNDLEFCNEKKNIQVVDIWLNSLKVEIADNAFFKIIQGVIKGLQGKKSKPFWKRSKDQRRRQLLRQRNNDDKEFFNEI